MDTAVDTRRGIIVTVLLNHILSAVFWFFSVLFIFKWLYNSNTGISILFFFSAAVYYSGYLSYAMEQPKLDLIIKKEYDWLMPLKFGGFGSLIIFLTAGVQYILHFISPVAGDLYGIFVKIFNYHIFYYLYGREGNFYSVFNLTVSIILPVILAYLGYYLGYKKFSFSELYSKIVYRRKK